MDNPIKYSEFIQPDQSVSNLIAQLTDLQTKYTELQTKISADASKIATSLKNVNSASEEGRESTRKAATETEKLAKSNENLKQSQTDVAKELALLKVQQQQQNNINKLTAKLNASTEGSYNKLSAQYSLNKIRLNEMSAAERGTTKEGKALEAQSKTIYLQMKQMQEATGKATLNVGNYKDSIHDTAAAANGLGGPLGNAANGVVNLGKKFLILAANPVVAIIALIAGLFVLFTKAMQRSEEGQDRLNKVMVVASSIFDNFMDVLTLIGIALFDTLPKGFKMFMNFFTIFSNGFKAEILKIRIAWNEFTGDAEEADAFKKELSDLQKETASLTKAQENLGKEIVETFSEATAKAKDLEAEIQRDIIAAQKLADAQAQYNKDERRILVENAKLNKQSAKERSDSERLKLLDAEESIKALERSFDLDEKALANNIKIKKAKADIAQQTSDLAVDDIEAKKAIAEAEAAVFDAETAFDNLRRQRIRRLNMLRLEAFKQEKARLKAYADLTKLEQASTVAANEAIIASDKATYEEKNRALKENAQLATSAINENTQIELKELDKRKELKLISDEDYSLQKRVIEAKSANDILKIGTKLQKDQEKVDATKRANDKKSREDSFKSATASIEQDFDLEMSRIDTLKETEAEKTRLRLEAEKDRIKRILELNKKAGGDLSAVQIATMQNVIKKIDQEIKKNSKNTGEDIYSALGLKLDDDERQAVEEGATFAIDNIKSIASARLEAADAVLQKATEERESAQSRLDAEIEARNNGYANNVETAQKELELQRKKEADALKEKKKAQKAQMAIDSITQASSLLTASTAIWKSLAGIPIVGVPLAVAGIATMWGSFAANKIKSKAAASETFGDGGLIELQGGSHASGNDIPIGRSVKGGDMRAEGGEAMAIINKRSSRKYKSALPGLIKSINAGTFEKAYGNAVIDSESGQTFYNSTDMSKVEKLLGDINKNGSRRTYRDSKGRLVEQYKNIKRVYV